MFFESFQNIEIQEKNKNNEKGRRVGGDIALLKCLIPWPKIASALEKRAILTT
jgi:hypothetical protein